MINTNATYYRVYALGEFCSLDRLVYSNWKVEDFDRSAIEGEHIVGMDFGFVNDPTAIVDAVAADKTLYICREWFGAGKTND